VRGGDSNTSQQIMRAHFMRLHALTPEATRTARLTIDRSRHLRNRRIAFQRVLAVQRTFRNAVRTRRSRPNGLMLQSPTPHHHRWGVRHVLGFRVGFDELPDAWRQPT
jgi:hypothetical protein